MRSFFVSVVFVVVVSLAFADLANGQKVRLRSQITPDCGSSGQLKYADIHADGNIAVMGSFNCRGVFIFDVSNPDNPVWVAWYNPGGNIQFLEAIVIGNRGYFGAGNNPSGNPGGVHIVDLTNPANPQLLGIVNASNGGGFPTIHEMMVFDQDGVRYLLENSNSTTNRALRIINVTDPANAVLKWQFNSSDSGWVHAMHIRGDRLFLSGFTSSTRVDIYDISNLAVNEPNRLGFVSVGLSANHSTWTTEDGNYMYSARETTASNGASPGDVRIYDVSNPAVPVMVNRITMSDLGLNAVTPHNPVVMGNKLYVSWYQAGLQVFDITDPVNLKRIGQYDTYSQAFSPEAAALETSDEPWDIMCGRDSLMNPLPTTYNGAWAVYPFLGEDRVLIGDLASGLIVVDVTKINENLKNVVSDFDGDGKTDAALYTASSGLWTIESSVTGAASYTQFGLPEDIMVPGDYDGDGKTDIAVWRPSNGYWYILGSSSGFMAIPFGLSTDIPVPGDYDADGKTDIAVWRPSNGVWYVMQSTLGMKYMQWGTSGDKVMATDFDGDGKADYVVWRPSNGVWYIMQSSSTIPLYAHFGMNGDKPLLADFDGDGRAELAVYRPSVGAWYMFNLATNEFQYRQFGIAEDIPVPADYDGDGKADVAVFRPSVNTWYRLNSSDGAFHWKVFGNAGDTPTPASVHP
jgi:hypothetical protein